MILIYWFNILITQHFTLKRFSNPAGVGLPLLNPKLGAGIMHAYLQNSLLLIWKKKKKNIE